MSKPSRMSWSNSFRAEAPAVEDDRHATLPHEAAEFGQQAGQHLDHPRVGLGGQDEQRVAFLVVDPVVGGGGHTQAHAGDVCLGQLALAVVDADVTVAT
jgi:hypothetical protein